MMIYVTVMMHHEICSRWSLVPADLLGPFTQSTSECLYVEALCSIPAIGAFPWRISSPQGPARERKLSADDRLAPEI
jgi:hypothetical protein